MPSFKYVIVGGGMTADAAVQGIREIDSTGSIAVISMEPDPPYDRPPLTKGLWKDKSIDSIWRGIEKKNVEFHPGRRVQRIDVPVKRVFDDQQTSYTYEKLLLAPGGRPRRFSFPDDGVIYY